VPLKSFKNTVVIETSNKSALFVLYLQQRHRRGMSFSFQDSVINVTQLVELCLACHIFSYWLTGALMHHLQVCWKISGHLQKIQNME